MISNLTLDHSWWQVSRVKQKMHFQNTWFHFLCKSALLYRVFTDFDKFHLFCFIQLVRQINDSDKSAGTFIIIIELLLYSPRFLKKTNRMWPPAVTPAMRAPVPSTATTRTVPNANAKTVSPTKRLKVNEIAKIVSLIARRLRKTLISPLVTVPRASQNPHQPSNPRVANHTSQKPRKTANQRRRSKQLNLTNHRRVHNPTRKRHLNQTNKLNRQQQQRKRSEDREKTCTLCHQ